MNKSNKTDLYITRIGNAIEFVMTGDKYVPRSMYVSKITDETAAMVWMWTNCDVPMVEFNKAMSQLRKNKHSHARFSSNNKLFLYSDNERFEE